MAVRRSGPHQGSGAIDQVPDRNVCPVYEIAARHIEMEIV